MTTYYKLARPDGWDSHTGRTINYRKAIGTTVQHPRPDPRLGLCSPGVLHASLRAEDCFQGASLPCSLYEVAGEPVLNNDPTKHGFTELTVVRELDPATHFRWRYAEAVNPFNPINLGVYGSVDDVALANLRQWASVADRVRASVETSVETRVADRVRASVETSVGASVADRVAASVETRVADRAGIIVAASVAASVGRHGVVDSLWKSVWDSIEASVWAYIGWLFAPVVPEWASQYPFQAGVDLWKKGLVPTFDGRLWRLHASPDAAIVWQGVP